jgi:hypothetical protein
MQVAAVEQLAKVTRPPAPAALIGQEARSLACLWDGVLVKGSVIILHVDPVAVTWSTGVASHRLLGDHLKRLF